MLLRLVQLYAALPLSWVRGLGRALGWLIYRLDSRYRASFKRHMALAGLSDPALLRKAVPGVGACMAESPWLWGQSPGRLSSMVVSDQLAMLQEIARSGQPTLFLAPHLGSFEMLPRFFSSFGKITVLYREPEARRLRPFMAIVRNTPGFKVAPATIGGVKTMLKALKAGECIGILPDQVPRSGEGHWTDFFGQPAYTMSLPQRLASTTGARVILAISEPVAGPGAARWRLHVEEMLEPPTPENINKRFEQLVLRLPQLYLWSYNRYKVPLGVAPPATGHPESPGAAPAGTRPSHDV